MTANGPGNIEPVYLDPSMFESPFPHDELIWLDPCRSRDDAQRLWETFGLSPTPDRLDQLTQLRPPKYLFWDSATGRVQLVDLTTVTRREIPGGVLVSGGDPSLEPQPGG